MPELTPSQSAQAAPFVSITLDARGLTALLRDGPAIVNQEILAALEEMGALFERSGAEEAPEGALGASGGLRGSVYHEIRGAPARELLAGWAAPHAEYVDRGRRPGKMPPSAPIELWVRKVLDVPEKDAHSVAYLIRRKIAKRGTRGTPFVLRTLHRLAPQAQQILARATERAAARRQGGPR